jgi:hypothetical protein
MFPKFCIKNKVLVDYNIVVIDFLNVYMRFIKGDYNNVNEQSFFNFIGIVSNFFKDKQIFFVKKVIWELPEEFLKKALVKHKNIKMFFVDVSNKNDNLKFKERDDFVCYSILSYIPSSILISNDSKILNPKDISIAGIKIDILSLHSLPFDIEKVTVKHCLYLDKGDYNRVYNFGFLRTKKSN